MVSVGQDGGAVFTAVLPGCLDAEVHGRWQPTRRRVRGPGSGVVIRTLVVDDDFRVAAIHAAYVSKVDGFEVIAQAHSRRRGGRRGGPAAPGPDAARPVPARTSTACKLRRRAAATATRRSTSS